MNLLITSAPARPLLQFVLVALALMPALIYGHGHHGSGKKHERALAQLANGAHLVMETDAGKVIMRPAREAGSDDPAPSAVPASAASPATVGGGGVPGGNKRVKNNHKKSNKSQNQMQHAAGGGRKPAGSKKPAVAAAGEEPLQQGAHHSNGKQQRQMLKHQQQQEHQHRNGKRSGTKSKSSDKGPTCRYTKSAWTECDAKTNMRTRILSLKKGESNCLPTRTMQKACKKACRYEKGPWSECTAGQMTREDKLKASEDGSQPSCNPVRAINKKCNPGAGAGGARATKERKHKEKGQRRASRQA